MRNSFFSMMGALTMIGADFGRDRDYTGIHVSRGPHYSQRKARQGKSGQGVRRQLRLQRRRNQKRRQRA